MTEAKPIDLGAFDTRKGAEDGIEHTLVAPDGTELPGFVVRGYDSASYSEALDANNRKYLKQGQRKRVPTMAEIEEDSLRTAAVLLKHWPDKFSLDGKPFLHSAENALTFLRRFPWARDQVEEVARARANFLPKSSTAS
jgi:hypothetical protein